jgi:23S rRNA U2552 (ribose-2'-O)-methylase RlmE/FtsJ
LAEGPGGFIEATKYLHNNVKDKYYGMTLINKQNISIPGWKKNSSKLEAHNIILEYGVDSTGDLYNYKNFIYCNNMYKNSMDIITADGGFDFSINFNKQEVMALKLILVEVLYAIIMQKKGGTFILKMFDVFLKPSLDILFILSCFYEKVYITKPFTSRTGNSEKYIICKNFKYLSSEMYIEKFASIIKIIKNFSNENIEQLTSIINVNINHLFKNKVEEFNCILTQQQMDNILYTINLINSVDKNHQIEYLKKNNIEKCIQWCRKHSISYNNLLKTEKNIFLKY